ncbi:hypothetical protein Tco_0981796 [Tanacetum coccineum]
MIVDLQRRLLSVEEVIKQLKTGPSDVDHLDKVVVDKEEVHVRVVDKEDVCNRAMDEEDMQERVVLTGNRFENVPVGGLKHQSMEGVSQCMNVDEPYKNWNDVLDNFHVDGLEH